MVQIRELTADDPDFAAWHGSIREAHLAGREPAWWSAVESVRAYLGRAPVRSRYVAVGAFEGRACVGGAEVELPLQHDTETMSVELGVLPAARGRGVGSALAAYLESLAAQQDRSIVQTELYLPLGAQLADTPGGRFALARGLRSVNTEDRFLLDLPYDEELRHELDRIEDGYRVTSFVDRVPDEHVVQWARMRTHMDQDVPTGQLTRTPQAIDVQRIRDAERNFAEQGWTRLRSLAFAPDGTGAGYSELFVSRYDEDFAVQDDTFVDRAHRGHRLGARMKLANLRGLAQHARSVGRSRRWVQTHTEQHNTPMQRTNEAFGFRRVDVLHELEGDVGGRH